MAYERLFFHFNSAFTSSTTLPSDLVEHAEFELLRQGGCGAATMTLAEDFPTDTLAVGDHVQFLYDSTTPLYLGRIEEISKSLPSGASVRLYGWLGYLNDLALGGRGKGDADVPLLYADDDYFVSDPDRDEQNHVSSSSIKTTIDDIYTNTIDGNTPIVSNLAATSTSNDTMKSMVFRGEENVSQIIRSLAVSAGWMSWGVDQQGRFFMYNLPSAYTHTYQIGVDVENLTETTDRSMMYNRIIMTGGPVYGNGTEHGFYHYKRNVVHYPSRTAYGEKKIALHLPWIRTDTDAQKFFDAFFQEYAGLTVRYTFDVSGLTSIPDPWTSRIRLLDANGVELKNAVPTVIKYTFNHSLVGSFTLGPEELQFPHDTHPQRYEDFSPLDLGDGQPFNCDGLSYPLAPLSGWGSTWECDPLGGWVFGYTTAAISAGTTIIGTVTTTPCQHIKYNPDTNSMEEVTDSTFDMLSFDPSLDGTASGAAVIARKIKDKYWAVWVGCGPNEEA